MNHCLFAALLIIVQNDEFAVIAACCELILGAVRQVERCDLIAGAQPAGLQDDMVSFMTSCKTISAVDFAGFANIRSIFLSLTNLR